MWLRQGSASAVGEAEAVDAVMGFALAAAAEGGLGYRPADVVLLGWSIGGYSASWAAMNYPAVGGGRRAKCTQG